MKRIGIWMLAMLMLCGCAMAEATTLTSGEALTLDVDGDGSAETLVWIAADEDGAHSTLTVTGTDGTISADTGFAARAMAVDLNGDGVMELLFSGDMASDDYYTECLYYRGGALRHALFADASRGRENDPNAYYKLGYGDVEAIGDGTVTLCGSQDILGTWFGSRTFTLTDEGLFELEDGGLWLRDTDWIDPEDDALWQYGALRATTEIAYTADDGAAAALRPGDQLFIIASDKSSTARFVTREGVTGTLAISPDWQNGYSWLVNGIPEGEVFEFIPYAD